MNIYKVLTKYSNGWYVILFLICSVLEYIGDSGQTYIVRLLFNNINNKHGAILYTAMLLGSYILFMVTDAVKRTVRISQGGITTNKLIEKIHRNVLHGYSPVIDNKKYSDIISAVECCEGLYNDAIAAIDNIIWMSVTWVGAIFFMGNINVYITGVCAIITIVIAFIIYQVRKPFSKLSKKGIESVRDRWDTINRLSGYKLIKSTLREKYEEKILKNKHEKIYDVFMEKNKWWILIDVLTQFMDLLVDGVILIMGVYFINKGEMSIVDALSLWTMSWGMLRPLRFLSQTVESISSVKSNIQKINNVLDIKKEPSGKIKLKEFRNEIRFDKFNFEYDDSNQVLKDISLVIRKGEHVGIYGPSGEGKSTIIKVLSKTHLGKDNQLFIDDIDINNLDNASLRRHLGIVSQEVTLFSDINIMENIRYGRLDATDEEVKEAAKKANIHDTIEMFPNGYNSMIGNNGVKLSGGEKQRIAIARTILQNPDILILDEATSGLDNISEKNVKDAISEITEGKTTIAIAHRLTTIKSYDRLIGIKNHKIVEEGTYDELINNPDSLLYDLQQSVE